MMQTNGRSPAILVESLSFSYLERFHALRDLNLRVQHGERVALIGPNGAGKSTLLLNLNGTLRGQGHIAINGVALSRSTVGQIRALVGLVFQSPDDQLFSPTVYDDVAYGPLYMGLPKEEIDRRVRDALEAVRMTGYEERMPHQLSMGQRKRVSIATVLSMDPAILALDEPTAALDPRARRTLIRLLLSLPQTLLIATHDLSFVREVASRTIVLDEGRIVADGETEGLLSDTALLDAHGLEIY
jgi:cobalt transport protein ATP-binding subunit